MNKYMVWTHKYSNDSFGNEWWKRGRERYSSLYSIQHMSSQRYLCTDSFLSHPPLHPWYDWQYQRSYETLPTELNTDIEWMSVKWSTLMTVTSPHMRVEIACSTLVRASSLCPPNDTWVSSALTISLIPSSRGPNSHTLSDVWRRRYDQLERAEAAATWERERGGINGGERRGDWPGGLVWMRGDAFPIWVGMSSSQMRSFFVLIHDGIDYRWHDTQSPDMRTHWNDSTNCFSNTLFTVNEYNIYCHCHL